LVGWLAVEYDAQFLELGDTQKEVAGPAARTVTAEVSALKLSDELRSLVGR